MRAFLHQDGEQLEPDRVELEHAPLTRHFKGVEVIDQIGHLQGTPPAALGTTQYRFDPRGQFRQGKRLEQVVVSTGAETLQTVVQLIAGGQHDDRRITPGIFAQALA